MAEDRRRVRIEAAGDDVDVAMATLPPYYSGTRWTSSATTGPYGFRYAALGQDDLTLRRSEMHGVIRGDVSSDDEYVVQWLAYGRAVVDVGRDAIVMEAHRPQLFPAHRPHQFDFQDYDQRIVHLSKRLVDEVAAERWPVPARGLRLDHRHRASDEAVRAWFEQVSRASRVMREATMNPLLWHEITHETSRRFLDLYPPGLEEYPATLLQPRLAHLRAAVDYIHANAHRPIDTTDIATASGLSVRGVQEAFRRTLDTTPLEALRTVRLDRVHEDLRVLGPADTSVREVALEWGFVHLGRFAAAYRERFGEYARDTLAD